MKKVTKAIFLLLSLAMLFSLSCGDDDDGGKKITGPGGTSSTTMNASISGKYTVNFSAISAFAQLVNSTHALVINGLASASNVSLGMLLSLNVTQGTGSFPLSLYATGDNDGLAAFTRTPSGEATEMFNAISGTVTITEMNTRIKGSFSFVGENSDGEQVTIANGSFNLALSTTE